MIEGYAESQKVILGLNNTYNIYLKSGNKKIKLLVTNTYIGQFHLTQAFLKPETKLEVGIEYTIYIDSLPDFEIFQKYNKNLEKNEVAKYKVIDKNDLDIPIISKKSKLLRKEYFELGCGPVILAIFNYPVKDSSEILARATVKNLKTGIETTYFLKPKEGEINVGHGMCSGAFKFENGNKFEVEFTFMDASGNLTSSVKRIKFSKPRKKIF